MVKERLLFFLRMHVDLYQAASLMHDERRASSGLPCHNIRRDSGTSTPCISPAGMHQDTEFEAGDMLLAVVNEC